MTTQEKREALAKFDADHWNYAEIYNVAMDGCSGYANMTAEEVEEYYKSILE